MTTPASMAQPIGHPVEQARQGEGGHHRAGAAGGEGKRGVALAHSELVLDQHDRVRDHHRAAGRELGSRLN